MSWNHRSRITAIAIAIQPTPGVFAAPGAGDIIAVSNVTNTDDMQSAADPTLTGAIWEERRVYLGRTSNVGFTFPLRGPGGVAPPAANDWAFGRVLQAAGFAEIRNGAAIAGETTQAGSTTSALALAAGQSAVDDALIGTPVQAAAIGAGAISGTSLISDYVGADRLASIPETIVAPGAGVAYTIPAFLAYVLGTLTTAPPLLSVSVWRDKKRYDFRDVVVSALTFDLPVANEANQTFPSADVTMRGVPVAKADEASPVIPQAILNVPVPALRGGKFLMDRVKLGHASLRVGMSADTGAASNANQEAGQDGYDILSGTRTVETDLNQMNISDFDIDARIDAQTQLPIFTSWGAGAGNRMGVLTPAVVLDPHNPGDRNGYVSLTGGAAHVNVDKSIAFAVWW